MDSCPFCAVSLKEASICVRCGWSPDCLPFEAPAWEKSSFLALNFSWLATLYQLLNDPRKFFRSLNLTKNTWRSWYFGAPLIFLIFFMAITLLPRMSLVLPSEIQSDWDLRFDTAVTLLIEQGMWSRFGYILFFLFETAGLWFLLVAAISSLLHLGVFFSGGTRVVWFHTFRMTSYALVPFLVVVLVSQLLLCLDPQIGFPPEGALPRLTEGFFTQVFKLLLIVWPYFLTIIALEEMHKVNRLRAQMIVLIGIFMGFFILMISGKVFAL